MAEVYGHQWASQQGDEPNDTWAQGLDGLSPEQYAHGFRALLSRADKWPPNLVEFRQMCTGYDPQAWERRAHKILRTDNMIEDATKKENDRQYRIEQMKKLREQVGI